MTSELSPEDIESERAKRKKELESKPKHGTYIKPKPKEKDDDYKPPIYGDVVVKGHIGSGWDSANW